MKQEDLIEILAAGVIEVEPLNELGDDGAVVEVTDADE